MSVSRLDLFQQEQIKLSQLSVYNWGSFHGLHTAPIDPDGTLITGDNGAGKSTLIDGLMALLLPAGKATFNVAAAQGERSDRSLLSYMRGSFGSAHDGSTTRIKSKREKAVVTGLRAMYQSEDGSKITLAALFWNTSSTNSLSDVKRIYIVAKRDLQLKELLDAFSDGNTRQLKQWLRDDPTITDCDNNFSDYQELYRKLLYMDNKNAPALLSRALGLKKIDDLTKLIRELVLEPCSVKDDAHKIVEEFKDLVAIYNELTDAKEQATHLSRLPKISETIDKLRHELNKLQTEKHHIGTYFAESLAALWVEVKKEIENKLDALQRDIDHAEIAEKDAQESRDKRHEEYLNLGGNKIESLKKDIDYTQDKLNSVIHASSNYQSDCNSLELSNELNEEFFINNINTADNKLKQIQYETKNSQDYFADVAANLSVKQQKLNDVDSEIKEIQAHPDSNIDYRYQKLRDEMVKSLDIVKDDLVFIGELIDVKDEQKTWQGAIERALGGLRTTLLIPEKNYSMVTRWLNIKHTGLHVRAQIAYKSESNQEHLDQTSKSNQFNRLNQTNHTDHANQFNHPNSHHFNKDGFLEKLIWKEHPYVEWLKTHLNKFDLKCVAGTDELDATPFSMTKEGLVHMQKGRFEKKDQTAINDRRGWCLGFSNTSRLSLLNHDKNILEEELKNITLNLDKARTSLNNIAEKSKIWERLKSYSWDNINAPYWQNRLSKIKADLSILEQTSGDLDQAKKRWDAANELLREIQNNKGQLLTQKGSLENDTAKSAQQILRYQQLASVEIPNEARVLLTQRIPTINIENADLQFQIEKDLDSELDKLRVAQNNAENNANSIMGAFRGKDKWTPITVDWTTGLDALPDYIEHYNYIEKEGLPQLIDQFKERLNKHATQSLARIKTKLESEREEILERINTINSVLKRTEFKQGSHLKIGSKREKYPHVLDFERKVKNALSSATSDNHELRFKLLADVVEILEKASASGTSNNMESLRLLDPRYQMSFFAEEIDSETDGIRDVLESSSGKSGGEKESFAGTIVAASLAYVLTPAGYDKPVYCTVFLDEAFSNTAETVSRRVLRVFKELQIHVNLITPYKNLNLARESARSLLIAERDSELHESNLCEVTWEEIDNKRKLNKSDDFMQTIKDEIKLTGMDNKVVNLGIDLDL